MFKEIVGKSYFITVKISVENVKNKSEVYESVDIAEDCMNSQAPVLGVDVSEEIDDNCLPTVCNLIKSLLCS